MKDSNVRSFIKGISWRIIGTIDTFLIAYFYFGDIKLAAPIAATEVLTKIFLYYMHERVWNIISWGRILNKPSHIRSLVKGISWRFLGSVDTMLISFLYSGNSLSSIKIGASEVLTKVGLFYMHERVWALIKWGRIYNFQTEEIQ